MYSCSSFNRSLQCTLHNVSCGYPCSTTAVFYMAHLISKLHSIPPMIQTEHVRTFKQSEIYRKNDPYSNNDISHVWSSSPHSPYFSLLQHHIMVSFWKRSATEFQKNSPFHTAPRPHIFSFSSLSLSFSYYFECQPNTIPSR